MVSETLRLPLRAVVASSSAMRSSRSAQQLPPRSAAEAMAGNPAIASTAVMPLSVLFVPERPVIVRPCNSHHLLDGAVINP